MPYDSKILERISKHMNIRFPIAKFSKDLVYSKGVISQYYNGKREISESFRKSFENFYKIKFSDFELGKDINEIEGKYPDIESFILNDKTFNSQKKISDLFRILIRNHSKLKENELYPLYRKYIIEDYNIDELNKESRDILSNKDED